MCNNELKNLQMQNIHRREMKQSHWVRLDMSNWALV